MPISKKWLVVQFISILRPIFAICFYGNWKVVTPITMRYFYFSLIFFTFVFLTDFLDGYLARKWNVTSSFGSVLDPICDKVSIYMLFFSFYYYGYLAVKSKMHFLILLIIIKDLMVMIGGVYTRYKFKQAILTTLGKSTMLFVGLLFALILLLNYEVFRNPIIVDLPIISNSLQTGKLFIYFSIFSFIYQLTSIIIFCYMVQYLYLIIKSIKANILE